MLRKLKIWARKLRLEVHAVYLASRSPLVPWYAKALAAAVAAYALSPIDLIPDFIPVLGWLDDLIIVPLGVWLVRRMIPDTVLAECRAQAAEAELLPRSRYAATLIVAIWLAGAASLAWIWSARRG
jgi:uncharacterized membrane protein YkvA (DUF1232 family)